jgi:hypothetical protein
MGRKDLLILLSPAIKVIIDVEVIVNVPERQTGNLRDKVANANMEFTALHRKTPCERDKKTQQKTPAIPRLLKTKELPGLNKYLDRPNQIDLLQEGVISGLCMGPSQDNKKPPRQP